MKHTVLHQWLALIGLGAIATAACDRAPDAAATAHDHAPAAAAPTNRVDIPAAVRQNLGITFARVETRGVANTMRVPGQFELLPTARREYRAPLPGNVDILVAQFQSIEPGSPLYRLDSAAWRDLHEQIAAAAAHVDSMAPLREAHEVHVGTLLEQVSLWENRITHLEAVREAGGGSASQFTDARAALSDAQSSLADAREKGAELLAQQQQAQAQLRALNARAEIVARAGACADQPAAQLQAVPSPGLTVCSLAPGLVELIAVTPGGLAAESDLVLSTVQPEQVRFRARGLQGDLGRLKDGLPTRIVPPQGSTVSLQDTMTGTLQLGLTADAEDRTLDLFAVPTTLAPWARAGVSAYLEVTLDGADAAPTLAIPAGAVVRDGATPFIFRRDPANPEKAIRMEADLGTSDGRWVVIKSGVREGDEVVVGGNYQLMLATSGSAPKGGHFHSDGTFHEGDD